jgi:Domain of unknown function (DUF1906)
MTVIDADSSVTSALDEIVAAGYTAVGRYYSSNSRKKLSPREAQAISSAGLQIFAVFEDGAKPALTEASGVRDAKIALQQATAASQPKGSGIYFALDSELGPDQVDGVKDYFSGIKSVIGDAYKLGVYADGVVCRALLDEGICQYSWLSASRGFPGSTAFYRSRRWSIAQDPNIDQKFNGLSIDTNETNGDFGSFQVARAPVAARAPAPVADGESTPWMDWMQSHRGEIQQTGAKPTPFTEEIFSHTNYGPLDGFTPESCAATVCAALEETGYKSTKSALAASYVNYGTPCELKPGCIVVFKWSNGGHHVDFCDQIIDSTTVRGLGGNQGHELQDSDFSRRFIIATRWPVKAQSVQQPRPLAAAYSEAPVQTLDFSKFQLGKRHARHDPRVPMLARYLPVKPLPAPPARVDWYSAVNKWGVMKNDALGDCTCAAVGHVILQWTTYASEARLLSDDEVLELYEVVGGYNPADASTDQGAVEVDVLNYWLNDGVFGDRLAGYASLEVGNIVEIKDAINWFGNVYIGLQLPVTAQTQQVWAVAPGGASGPGAPGSWGGHAVPVVGYDERGLICITWGELKRMTYEFWSTYCDEAYALLSTDFVEAAGTTPGGLSWDELQADMQALKSGYVSAQPIRHI